VGAYAITLFDVQPTDLTTTVLVAKMGLAIMDREKLKIEEIVVGAWMGCHGRIPRKSMAKL
jgi:hypothetical protein